MEPVLKHRRALEEQAAAALAQAQREFICCRENLLKTRALLQETFAETEPGRFDVVSGLQMSLYREHLTFTRNCQEEEVKKAGARVEECRSTAVEKRREKLVLEKLRQKKYAAYCAEMNGVEQKEYDEQGTQRAGYNSRLSFMHQGGD
ncbi:MAG: flagellar export protein FliJ [Bacillota bacterium]